MGLSVGALETLKLLKDFVLENNKNGLDRIFIIGSFDTLEKELKAFEIIKEKRVSVHFLRYSFILEEITEDGIEYYNKHFENEDFQLTKEEYDLLKEAL